MNIFLDDVRTPDMVYPDDGTEWCVVRDPEQCKRFIAGDDVHIISFDHDLGACNACLGGLTPEEWMEDNDYESMPNCTHFGTGYTIACYMEELIRTDKIKGPKYMYVHSANPVGRKRIKAVIESIKKYRGG